MRVLAIESSCDETAAAVIEDGRVARSSVVASQVDLHAMFIWSTVHGLASIRQGSCMEHLHLAPGVGPQHIAGHALGMIERALRSGTCG